MQLIKYTLKSCTSWICVGVKWYNVTNKWRLIENKTTENWQAMYGLDYNITHADLA